jgi:hypothetical protein
MIDGREWYLEKTVSEVTGRTFHNTTAPTEYDGHSTCGAHDPFVDSVPQSLILLPRQDSC